MNKGGVKPPSAPGSAEDRLASERQRQAEAARIAELKKNVDYINRGGQGVATVDHDHDRDHGAGRGATPVAVDAPGVDAGDSGAHSCARHCRGAAATRTGAGADARPGARCRR